MIKLNVIIKSRVGLHARPASELVKTASAFSSNITIKNKERSGNAKSIMSILSIAAAHGDEIEITAEGQDEKEAILGLKDLFENRMESM